MRKEFKKLGAILVGVALSIAMIGCGSTQTDTSASAEVSSAATEAPEETSTSSEESPETTSTDGAKDALKGVKLSVGTSGLFAPFSYYDEDGTTLIGFDLDFMKALQDYLGFEIDGSVQAMDYSALTASVAEGKLDFAMAALCATDERKQVMNFSDTYCDSGLMVMVNSETSPKEITGSEVLTKGDYVIAVEKGTCSHLWCVNSGIPDDKIQIHDEITTAYESLEQGKVDCLLQDGPNAAYYVKTQPDTKLVTVGDEFNQGQAPYAIAISFKAAEANPEIVTYFNEAIKALEADGTMNELRAKWLE